MKYTTLIAALMLGTAANAFPAHQQDGYRDTGCDEAARVEIRNDAGELLYVNNETCPDVGGASNAEFIAAFEAAFPAAPTAPAAPVKK
jgi:hypothetical protein